MSSAAFCRCRSIHAGDLVCYLQSDPVSQEDEALGCQHQSGHGAAAAELCAGHQPHRHAGSLSGHWHLPPLLHPGCHFLDHHYVQVSTRVAVGEESREVSVTVMCDGSEHTWSCRRRGVWYVCIRVTSK